MADREAYNPFAPPEAPSLSVNAMTTTDVRELTSVGKGLFLVYLSMAAAAVGLTGIAYASLRVPNLSSFSLVGLMLVALLLTGLLQISGLWLCTTVPQRSDAKKVVTCSAAFFTGYLILAAICLMPGGFGVEVLVGMAISIWLSLLCFLIFLHRLSRFIGHANFTQRSGRMLLSYWGILVLGISLFSIAPFIAVDSLFVLIPIVVCVTTFLVFIGFANLVNDMATFIRKTKAGS